jgi:hypothetical protein
MIKSTLPAVFAAFILLTGALAGSIDLIPQADAVAMKAKGVSQNQFGSATKNKVCGDRLCSEPKEGTKEEPAVEEEPVKEETTKTEEESEPTTETPTEPVKEPVKEETTPTKAPVTTMKPKAERKIVSGTMTSSQDPGVGHESHQLAVILPPSDNVYEGVLTYTASEPIQLVTLHGPIAEGDDMGQAIWSPDGETKFGLTFIDNGDNAGTWYFTGNALAVHTMSKEPFSVSYTLSYTESPMSDTVQTGTLHSVQDPGLGHETHQLAIVLPPRDEPYFGTVAFTASERIQLVALHGPLTDDQDIGQPIWTPDGETKFAMTFVDKGEDNGVWKFAGNALAFHTTKETPFTVTYSVSVE